MLVLVAPALLFPSVRPLLTAIGLVALAAVWLARWAVRREPWPVTPFNGPLLLFAVMIPLGIWASPLPELTLPKATGLVLGLAVFRAVGLAVRSRRSFLVALAVFCALGLGLALVGALSAQWMIKAPALSGLARHIPRLIGSLPDLAAAGVHPNMIAGVLALYLPALLALVGARRLLPVSRVLRLLLAAAWGMAVLLVAGLLVLTQSRSGWIGGAAGLLALWALWGVSDSRCWTGVAGMALPLLALAAAVGGILYLGPQQVWEMLYEAGSSGAVEDVVGSISVAGRIEIWNRSLYAIRDMPFTGCGLGAFRGIVSVFYPLFLTAPDYDISHAHNIFLQTALDLGLPGLAAYLALLGVAAAACWRPSRQGDPLVRFAALGLLAGLVGLHVYGLTDALALGSKPGGVFWLALALVAGLERLPWVGQVVPPAEDAPPAGAEQAWRQLSACLTADGSGIDGRVTDWEAVVALAERLGLGPLLFRLLKQRDIALPPDLRARLSNAYWVTLGKNLRYERRLAEVVRTLQDSGVPCLVLKGLALAQMAYPDPGTRGMGDIDLLVAERDVERVGGLLEGLGYLPVAEASHPEGFVRRFDGERTFYQPDAFGCPIELHWRLVNYDWSRTTARIEMDELWSRARPLTLEDVTALQLALEDTLLHLCVHMAIHHDFRGIGQFVDLDRLVRQNPGLDWEAVIERACRFRLRSVVYFSLLFTRRLFETPIPGAVLQQLAPPLSVRWIVGQLVDPLGPVLGKRARLKTQSERFLHFLLVDRRQDRLRGLVRVFFPGRDWIAARYSVGRPYRLALYIVLHPLRMVWLATLAFGQLAGLGGGG